MRTVNVDGTISGADWIKSGEWDLLDIDTGPKLNSFLWQHGLTPKEFMALPVFVANVASMPWLDRWARKHA